MEKGKGPLPSGEGGAERRVRGVFIARQWPPEPFSNCSISPRASPSSPAARAVSGSRWPEGLAEAGASLMLCARREQWLTPAIDAMRKRGVRVEGKLCDVTDPKQVENVVADTIAKFGKVDILINNAGISWGERPEAMPLEQWKRVLDTNLTGAFLFAQAAGREMLKKKSGSIINIASVAGMRSSTAGPHYAGYAASKAGLMGLTRELAASWGPQGIRVNAIAPGFFTRVSPIRSSVSWSRRSKSAIRFRASATPASSKAWRFFSPRMRRATSPGRSSPSMAASDDHMKRTVDRSLRLLGAAAHELSAAAARRHSAPDRRRRSRPSGNRIPRRAADVGGKSKSAATVSRLRWRDSASRRAIASASCCRTVRNI